MSSATAALRLVLLDRDGTINRKAPEGQYITSADDLVLLPGAVGAVRRLNDAGVVVAVVTNQRGIARRRMTEGDLRDIHAALERDLAAGGAHVDAIYHCPHERGTCGCRKPETGMLESAARAFGIELRAAAMIGDSPSDVEAGRRAGAFTVRLSGTEAPEADLTAPSLDAAVRLLLASVGSGARPEP
jgi:D-glycero-D-manno-heptose 1,7-bisphosphate phosphatase